MLYFNTNVGATLCPATGVPSEKGAKKMVEEYRLHLQIKHVENGQHLATSDDLPGLVAQGRTVAETVEIARDVARKLIEP